MTIEFVRCHPKNHGGDRTADKIKYIVYHYTGNDGDRAMNNAKYFRDNVVQSSAHYFVDDDKVVQSVDDLTVAWAVGGIKKADCAKTGGGTLYGKATNTNSISVEMCDTSRDGALMATEATLARAVELGKMLMEKYDIPIERVIRHFDVTGKHCPAYFMDADKWAAFKARLAEQEDTMKYTVKNGVHIVEIPVKDFHITVRDCLKKNTGRQNICNAGYFTPVGSYTFPVNHVVADYYGGTALKEHLQRCGTVENGKATFSTSGQPANSQFGQKAVTTLIIKDGKASIGEYIKLPDGVTYALGGVPIMRSGADVKFATFVKGQGWTGAELRATWHTFLGLKSDATKVYVIGMKTTTPNCVYSAEAYSKFKALGFTDVMKFDGGGSFYLNVGGKITQTSENRRDCTFFEWDATSKTTTTTASTASKNPYTVPTRALTKGCTGNDVKWLQWELNKRGFSCGAVDGSFGSGTKTAVEKWQKANGLTVDGSFGAKSRAKMLGG